MPEGPADLVQALAIPAALVSEQGIILACNAELGALLGRDPAELLSVRWLDLIVPEDRPVAAGGTPAAKDISGSNVAIVGWSRPNGDVLAARPSLGPALPGIGQVLTVTDVTRQVAAERATAAARQELTGMAAALADAREGLDRFAYAASHDLREPLRTIGGFADLLARGYRGRLDADADDFIDFILGGVARGQELVDALLAYSRVDRHGAPLRPMPAGDALDEALRPMEERIRDSGGTVTASALPDVLADPAQLSQLFTILVTNALTYVVSGTAPRIQVSGRTADGVTTFRVADNGIGIPPQHRTKVFGLFQRLHGRGQYPGVGIGLAVGQRIVERHRGAIWVEAGEDGGSRFCFTMRAAP